MLTIRPYEDRDLDATVTLWHAAWSASFPHLTHPDPYERWRSRFRDEIVPAFSVWVAEDEGRIAGFLALDPDRGYLDQIFVSPDAQGRGAGAALLQQAMRLSPAGLTLHTLIENTAARAFYERHGFQPGEMGTNAVNGRPNIAYHRRGA